jgi:hypothetical protein
MKRMVRSGKGIVNCGSGGVLIILILFLMIILNIRHRLG